jgi:hypothetical protein
MHRQSDFTTVNNNEMSLNNAAWKTSIETRLSLSRSCSEKHQSSGGGGRDSLRHSAKCISRAG